jgi:hypothetical protein
VGWAEVHLIAGEIAPMWPEPDAAKVDAYLVESGRSRLRESSRQSPGHCTQQSAWCGFGATKGRDSKLANCSLRFMAVSPKGSTRAI